MKTALPFILASGSPSRLTLLKQIGIYPDKILPADIDEQALKGETGRHMSGRLALEKAEAVSKDFDKAIILSADTVPVTGRTIMRKAENEDDIITSLKMISGKRHRLYTGICVIAKNNGQKLVRQKIVTSILKFKKLSDKEIIAYANLKEGIGKAGGYAVNGYAETFLSFLSGSFSNIVGLPLYETKNMLDSVLYLAK